MKSLSAIVCGRRTAWVVLAVCLIALGLALALVPRTSSVAQANPASAGDSDYLAQWLTHIPSANTTNGIVVWTRTDGQPLTASQQAVVRTRGAAVAALSPAPKVAWTQLSPDRTTVLVLVPMQTPRVLANAPAIANSITSTARSGLPSGVRVQLTGQLATLADNARATGAAADETLGFSLLIVAAVLLIVATRSIVLWLIPLVLAAAAAEVADLVGASTADALGLPISLRFSPLPFALALGLTTAQSVVFVLRAQRESASTNDRHEAAARAWATTAPGIAVSAAILVVGTAVFLFAPDSRIRALAVAAVIGMVIATLTVLLAVASGFSLFAHRSLWLALPDGRGSANPPSGRATRHSVLIALVMAIVVAGAMTAAAALVVHSTAPATDTQAAEARGSIDRAFTPGYGNESTMMVPNVLKGDTSVLAPTTLAMNLPNAHAVTVGDSYNGFAVLKTDFDIDPGSAAALGTIQKLRTLIASKGAPTSMTRVGGPDATTLDLVNAKTTELTTLTPISIVLMLALLYLVDLRERRRGAKTPISS